MTASRAHSGRHLGDRSAARWRRETSRWGAAARVGGALTAAIALVAAGPASVARADWVRDLQWHLTSLSVPDAWAQTRGEGVTVAILETGLVDAEHPDLSGNVEPGTDLTGAGQIADHATGIAGIIAAHGRDGDGVIGVAPAARILPVTTSDARTLAAGFRWATDNGADVINCSCSLGPDDAPEVRDAIAYALSQDIVVVVGVGNTSGPVGVPGRYDGVIGTSGLTQQDGLTTISSRGPEVDLAAPAQDLPAPAAGGGYVRGSDGGTSIAAAVVSGVVALVRSAYPNLDAANVVNRVVSTARDIGAPGRDDEFGYGSVDPVAALTADVPPVAENPLGSPGTGGSSQLPPSSARPSATTHPTGAATEPCDTSGTGASAQPPNSVQPSGADAPAPPLPAAPTPPTGMLRLAQSSDCGGVVVAGSDSTDGADWLPLVLAGAGGAVLVGSLAWGIRRRRSASEPVS